MSEILREFIQMFVAKLSTQESQKKAATLTLESGEPGWSLKLEKKVQRTIGQKVQK